MAEVVPAVRLLVSTGLSVLAFCVLLIFINVKFVIGQMGLKYGFWSASRNPLFLPKCIPVCISYLEKKEKQSKIRPQVEHIITGSFCGIVHSFLVNDNRK